MKAHLLDANALIYYYRNNPLGQRVEELRRRTDLGPFYVTTLAALEVRAAFGRFVRGGHISAREHDLLVKGFEHDRCSLGWLKLQPIRRDFLLPCIRLIEDYGLRGDCGLHTQDCIHLRSALDLRQREPDVCLVTADRAFAGVAQQAGLLVELLAM